VAFYYGWYGNPATDGRYQNWNHAVADNSGRQFPGGDDIGANYYPQAGCYSSNDPATLDRQMRELRRARVGVICASWWGKDTFTDRSLPRLLDAAAGHGLKVNLHMEPFPGRNATTTRAAVVYAIDTYGRHPAFHRSAEFGGRPAFFVYDSYLTPAREWAEVFSPAGVNTLRGTAYDAAVIGLWVKEGDGRFMTEGHFDGYYTYFAADGFTWGSTTRNWPQMARFAREHRLLFIPSVGPGYIDTRIRPWNGSTTRDREQGAYYDRLFQAAIASGAPLISITSFNEWHEGTQIEPAAVKRLPGFSYLDFAPRSPDYYLERTAYWVGRWKQ
jgi:glycoprotein endo-alpha-1,2-mannosidase